MQVADFRAGLSVRAAALILFTATALLISPTHASGAVETTAFNIAGPGTTHTGREIRVSAAVRNTATDPAVTPKLIDRIAISSNSIRFNGDADGITTCHAKIPNNGDSADCPRRSLVGSGTVAGILGTPGQPSDTFGPLSSVSGKFKLYNYRHRRRESARMIAVIETTKPFGGISINLKIPISRSGVITVDVPDLPQLPSLIRKAYPKDTRLVITSLSARIDAPRRRRTKPFAWLRTRRSLGFDFQVNGE